MDLSIIIPCFNHGPYLDEVIGSIKTISDIKYEVIIVNDGSTDAFTLTKLKEMETQGFTVISHQNSGPAFSRNAGIKVARGTYILPLDADNKVLPTYIVKGIKILQGGQFDIVYGNPIFFGEGTIAREFETKNFNIGDLFISNYIDTCALYKKEVWEKTGGYDPKLPFHGQEDWEFWINASSKGFKFYHIDEGLYYYRVLNNSLAANLKQDKDNLNHDYILKKHFELFTKTMIANYTYGKMYQRDLQQPLRASLKYLVRFFKSSKH